MSLAPCVKCEAPRSSAPKNRRLHGHDDLCGKCYSPIAHSARNARISPDKRRQWNFSSRYGLTVDQVEEMLARQDGACAICHKPLTKFHVDHCHTTGNVRGLLCSPCNRKLSLVENPDLLASALAYLKRAKS